MDDMEALVADITGKQIEQPSQPVSHETPPQVATPEPATPARDEAGRFAAKPVETTQPAETPPAAAPQAAPDAKTTDGMPPPYALAWKAERNEERERRQALERELDALRAQQPQQQAQVPNPLEDPDGYRNAIAEQIQRVAINERINVSTIVARQAIGDELVDKALAWGQEKLDTLSPDEKRAFARTQISQPHPIDWLVKQMKREELVSQIDLADPDAWVRKRYAELTAQTPSPQIVPANGMAAQTQPQASRQPSPQRSLAAAPTAGSHTGSVPIGLEATMDAVFPTG